MKASNFIKKRDSGAGVFLQILQNVFFCSNNFTLQRLAIYNKNKNVITHIQNPNRNIKIIMKMELCNKN